MFTHECIITSAIKEYAIKQLTGHRTIVMYDMDIDMQIAKMRNNDKYLEKMNKKYPYYESKLLIGFRHNPSLINMQLLRKIDRPEVNTVEAIHFCERKIKEYDFEPEVFLFINDVFDTCEVKAKYKYNQLFILHNLGLI